MLHFQSKDHSPGLISMIHMYFGINFVTFYISNTNIQKIIYLYNPE